MLLLSARLVGHKKCPTFCDVVAFPKAHETEINVPLFLMLLLSKMLTGQIQRSAVCVGPSGRFCGTESVSCCFSLLI